MNPVVPPKPHNDHRIRLTNEDFVHAFPYHVVVDQECRLIQAGKEL